VPASDAAAIGGGGGIGRGIGCGIGCGIGRGIGRGIGCGIRRGIRRGAGGGAGRGVGALADRGGFGRAEQAAGQLDADVQKMQREADDQRDRERAVRGHPFLFEPAAEQIGERQQNAEHQAGGAPVEREQLGREREAGERGERGIAREQSVQQPEDEHQRAEGNVDFVEELVERAVFADARNVLEGGQHGADHREPGKDHTDCHSGFSSLQQLNKVCPSYRIGPEKA
jgi:hypothetical protein